MSTALLPIIQAAPMSLCSICAEPGACCQNVNLHVKGESITFWEVSWRSDSKREMRERGLPFFASSVRSRHKDEDGSDYVTLWFDCPKLQPDGRCGIYADRPRLCRTYLPGQDDLCVMTNMAPRVNEAT